MKALGLKSTKAEFDQVLQGLGKSDTHNVGEPVFYIELAEPLDKETDYLVTVEVNGKTYGLTRPHEGDYLDDRIIYFSLTDGAQIDFVDGKRKSNNANAKCDLTHYSGTAKVTLYKTDPQASGVYPTGLVKVKEQTVQIENGD